MNISEMIAQLQRQQAQMEAFFDGYKWACETEMQWREQERQEELFRFYKRQRKAKLGLMPKTRGGVRKGWPYCTKIRFQLLCPTAIRRTATLCPFQSNPTMRCEHVSPGNHSS